MESLILLSFFLLSLCCEELLIIKHLVFVTSFLCHLLLSDRVTLHLVDETDQCSRLGFLLSLIYKSFCDSGTCVAFIFCDGSVGNLFDFSADHSARRQGKRVLLLVLFFNLILLDCFFRQSLKVLLLFHFLLINLRPHILDTKYFICHLVLR